MFLLICDKTTFLKHFDYWTKIQRLVTAPKLPLCMSSNVSSEHIPAHTECGGEVFFVFSCLLRILLRPYNSLGFLCLCSSILKHETQNCTEHCDSDSVLQVSSISPFLLCSSSPLFFHLPVLPLIYPSILNIPGKAVSSWRPNNAP